MDTDYNMENSRSDWDQMTISFTPGMRTHTIVMKLKDYI